MDVFMGDWDRHAAQWHWLRFDEGGRRDWRAVPVDRDQAFARFDGVFPSIAEYYLKQFASFGDEYPAIDKLTFAARHTDRRFLVGLEEADWRDVTSNVVARLTDDAIAGAVRQLPPELYARDHARLERALRARRDAPPPRAPSTGCSPRTWTRTGRTRPTWPRSADLATAGSTCR